MSTIHRLQIRGRAARHRARIAWAPSRVRRLLRHRAVTGFVAVALFGASALVAADRLQQAERAQRAWGTGVEVVVVARAVPAGEPLRDALRLVERPLAMVPDAAARTLPPGDARAAVDLAAGEVLVSDRLVGAGVDGLPAGRVAVAVGVDDDTTPVEPGDLADLWSTDRRADEVTLIAEAVVVLDVDDDRLTVAVLPDQVPAVARAANDEITVARR